jgi:response regulator RpfG family c-di-GMP phosphodiesterase
LPDRNAAERVLLVDDERPIVDACTMGLNRAGYDVRATTSPHEAIEIAIREPIDLVLTDIMMPQMSGIELLRTVKHLYPDAAGVMITGHGTMDAAIEALRAGATGFLLKPFTASELRMAVEDALSKSRVLKENVRLKTMLPLYESSKAFYGEMGLHQLTRTIVEQVARNVAADHVSLLLAEAPSPDGAPFRVAAAYPPNGVVTQVSEDVLTWVAKTEEPLVLNEGAATNLPAQLAGTPPPSAVMYLPLLANKKLVGILRIRKTGGSQTFGDPEIEMLTIQGSQAAIALQNAQLLKSVEDGYLDALSTLANVLEARDIETRGHVERLANNCVLIAKQLGLTAEDVEAVRVGALLHDIGKIGIPDAILRKPSSLSPEEYEVVRRHPVIGDRILAPIPQLQKARAAVLSHHERWDGTGYPFGLEAERIPLTARIVCVADAFDAMTETKPYHSGQSVVKALEELQRCKGTQFDPKVVDAFFEVLSAVQHATV